MTSRDFTVVAVLYLVIGVAIGVFLKQNAGAIHEFNWKWLGGYLFIGIMAALGTWGIMTSDSGIGHFGGWQMLGSLAALLFSAMLLTTMLPKEWIEPAANFVRPYNPQFAKKPHLAEFVPDPADPVLPVKWVRMQFPNGAGPTITPSAAPGGTPTVTPGTATAVMIQIRMTPETALEGFPVPANVLDDAGNIIGWYKEGDNKTGFRDSRTEDF